jgi:hypothetical protein
MTRLTPQNLKRAYFDIRNGIGVIGPLVQFFNFVMLFYLVLNKTDWLWIAMPAVIAGLFVAMLITGNIFRRVQLGTDFDLSYERSPEQAKTNRIILDALYKINPSPEIEARLEYLRHIENQK